MTDTTNPATTPEPTPEPADAYVGFTEAELEVLTGRLSKLAEIDRSVLAKLGHRNSVRGKRRALAFLIGHESGGRIRVYKLRLACTREGIYSTRSHRANFTQDMRKDTARGLWTEHTYRSGRQLCGYWSLTEKGAELARRYAALVSATPGEQRTRLIETHKVVARSIVIRPKAASCPFCREAITDDDKAVCSGYAATRERYNAVTGYYQTVDLSGCGCGNQIHASCLIEFHRPRPSYGMARAYSNNHDDACVIANTTAYCQGRYKIIACPAADEPATAPATEPA